MTAHETILSVQEVNQRLPLVRAIVRDVVELKADVSQRHDRLMEIRELHPAHDAETTPYAEEVMAMRDAITVDEQRLTAFEEELEIVGGVLVDAASGLVEFASELDGRSVWLSWLPSDAEVSYWREASDSVAVRKPLIHEVAGMGVEECRSES